METSKIIYELPHANLELWENFIPETSCLFNELNNQIAWRQDKIKIAGKEVLIPRLHQWYGQKDKTYSWSGLKMEPLEWIIPLKQIKESIEQVSETIYNSVLVNLYRDGNDSVGWHADNEPELGNNPVIASISLGETREFILRYNEDHNCQFPILLTNGSLLIMSGETQKYWKHSIPKDKNVKKPRINLTFRKII